MLFAACEGAPAELYQGSRGWSTEDWHDAVERLASRGLLAESGTPTDRGRAFRAEIEERTDVLAVDPYARIPGDRTERLLTHLAPAAAQVAAAGEITFPNPMGLPRDMDVATR